MQRKIIRVSFRNFWPLWKGEHFARRFPFLRRKYEFISDDCDPQFIIFSVFEEGHCKKSMPSLPDIGIPRIFITAENVKPDMSNTEFAVSFARDIVNKRHIRIPNWVQRLAIAGYSPADLLSSCRFHQGNRDRFCAFIAAKSVIFREHFVSVLSYRKQVDCPGQSMNNTRNIGPSITDKIEFLKNYRFSIAFENERSPGYTTEKLVDAFLSGCLPIYYGDPLVGLDFNSESFVNMDSFGCFEQLADEIIRIENDSAVWYKFSEQPVFFDDRIPQCADAEMIFSFWESIFDG